MLRDFVAETANNPGTGTTVTLLGATTEGRPWLGSGRFSDGDQVFYVLKSGAMREWGIGRVFATAPNTLTRDTVMGNSSGTTSRLNFTGTTIVYNGLPSSRMPFLDADGKLNASWTNVGLQSQLRSAIAVNIGNNTLSVFPWDSAEVNTLGLIAATPVGVLTIAVAGFYRFQVNLHFPANATGQRIMNLVVGGNTVRAHDRAVGNVSVPAALSCAWEAPLSAGTQCRVDITQDSGGTMAVGGTTWSNFSVTRLS